MTPFTRTMRKAPSTGTMPQSVARAEAGSVFGSVVALMGRGFTPAGAARELGIRADVAEAVAEEAQRLGLVVDTGTACGTGCTPGAKIACAGCPLSH